MAQLWYAGICDRVLARLQAWYVHYDKGAVFSTRPFLNHDGSITEIVQKREHKVPWTRQELDKLCAILAALRPKSPLVQDMQKLRDHIERCPLVANGYREAKLVFYKADVKEMIDALREAKEGRTESVTELLESAKSKGTGIWG